MTLVVAQMHDDSISVVADTKITDELGDETWNRHAFRNACPKIAILRNDLAVGVAGGNPHIALRRLGELRSSRVDEVVNVLAGEQYASFIVAALSPVRQLWQIDQGTVSDRSQIGRSWVGDYRANEVYRERYHEFEQQGSEVEFCMSGALQWLLHLGDIETVGGYITRLRTSHAGFRFALDHTSVGPDLVHGVLQRTWEGSTITFQTPSGVSSHGYEARLAVGQDPTISALACLIPQAHTAWLFCDSSPWEARVIKTDSMAELIKKASDDYGQKLISTSS